MAELKTKATKQPVSEFLKTITPEEKQIDSFTLLALFEKITGEKAVMWGTSIVGFGMYHYKSERSSQEGDWPLVAFSPRKQNLTLYIMAGNTDEDILKKLGKYKVSGGCLYIKKLADIDQKVLASIIKKRFNEIKKKLIR
ncbi:MAG: DUF1801 domain-containing protein [Patescibacteria group bacterium]